ncbi:hypothetical protein [Nocardia pseudobrasiliensis]|uniref:Uncharacterized protein n=1 Tax=Nocardia pseudobrasiliensis TaxID=45979 RepID=A0A370I4R9_9NOCA|nr:hypothetical protein [Nocardia pseudobrasiliensis]RDI64334.1 hypothetical protein DFR76_108166 [Nocardia pseudobrasiliensis]
MVRIGIWLAVLGFGSLLLQQLDMHFIILAWADEMQPWFGIVLGAAGLLVALGGAVASNTAKDEV